MGYNTVAVLYNDMSQEISEAMPRLGQAMRAYGWKRSSVDRNFGSGVVISQEHADWLQVVVAGRNTGWAIGRDEDVPDYVMEAVCRAIDAAGWKKVRGKWVRP